MCIFLNCFDSWSVHVEPTVPNGLWKMASWSTWVKVIDYPKIIDTTTTLTLTGTNIAPESGWMEDEFPFGMAHLQVLCEFQGV